MAERPKKTPEEMAEDLKKLKERAPSILKSIADFFNPLLDDEDKEGKNNGDE